MFLADGSNDLVKIAEVSGVPFDEIERIASLLHHHKMIDIAWKSDVINYLWFEVGE